MFSFNTLLLRKRFPDQNLRSYSSLNLYYYWERLQAGINNVRWNIRYPGNLYASISFMPPYPLIIDFDVLILAFIQLLEQYTYKLDSNYIKFTIGYNMNLPNTSDLSFTLGKAIPLLELEIDRKARIWARVSRKQKISILVLSSAMGSNLREIIENVCYPEIFLSFLNDKEKKKIGSKENAILEFYQQFACVGGDPVFSEFLCKELQMLAL
uniref:DNA-directed RNA polymerase n=1 Tax=Kalanchoe fedtschenkoi TaxID=63787 RepID=A0A7N0RAQ6_KALFE